MKNTVLLIFVVITLTACDGLGESPCGNTTCDAGTYCADEEFSSCLPGCLTDDNCNWSSHCALGSGEAVGNCTPNEEEEPSSSSSPQTWTVACMASCDDYSFFQCIDQSMMTACTLWCEEASKQESEAFIACERASDCNFEACFHP